MQVDVALEVLGLSGEPTAVEVRRAYLRQVKLHPPERDADGFRRVREAYERLQAGYVASPVAPPVPAVAEEPRGAPIPVPSPERAEAAPAVVAPPVPSFWQPVQEQLELLKRALAEGDPVAAAERMIWLLDRPLIESAPTPTPLLVLETVLALMDRGRFRRAGALLEALDRHQAADPQPGGFGNEAAARWKLASELMAVSELDTRLARALASGLRREQLHTAAGAANAALEEYGPELERHMRERAPSLWGLVAPLLSEPEPTRQVPLRSSGGFKIGGWPAGVVAVVVMNLFRLLAVSEHPSPRATVDYSVPEPRLDASGLAAPPEVPRDVSAPVPDMSAGTLDLGTKLADSPAPRIMGWGLIQESLRIGDCQTVRESWRPYLKLSAGAHSDRAVEASRKRRILEMCPELQELLEEPP